MPAAAVGGGVDAVKRGAAGAGSVVIVMGSVVAVGSTPLYAVTVKVLLPTVVGYPLRLPSNSSSSKPSGRDPCDTVNSGVGYPDAANV